MISRTNEILSKGEERVFIADTGYYNVKEIKDCTDDTNIVYLKAQRKKKTIDNATYSKDNFSYQKKKIVIFVLKGRLLPLEKEPRKMD